MTGLVSLSLFVGMLAFPYRSVKEKAMDDAEMAMIVIVITIITVTGVLVIPPLVKIKRMNVFIAGFLV